MQNASLWRTVLGVENTVVEDIEFNDDTQAIVAHVRPARATRVVVERAVRGPLGTTVGRVDGSGAAWIWEPFESSWKQMLRGSIVAFTGRRCARSRGLVTAPGTRARSISRSPGWPHSARRRQSPN